MGGMRVGSKHNWIYSQGRWRETKVSPRKWTFEYRNSKSRSRSAPRGSGMPVGSKLIWEIDAKQYAVKVSPNRYKLITKGVKRQRAFKTPRMRRLKYTKRYSR